jgi:DNA-binding response OmpR family regulator
MPGIGGAELATKLTAARPNLLVLYISGYPDRRESNLDDSQAGQAYLQKPFTLNQLVHKVREVLDACAH